MKKRGSRILAAVLGTALLLSLAACTSKPPVAEITPTPEPEPVGQIYLYGEAHGIAKILDRELELWNEYYHGDGMRHLFIEYPYYTAEFLNFWMQTDNDDILDAVYDDWAGTAAQVPEVKAFYQAIKEQCPETIFHGTDVGHQAKTTGQRYLRYLRENGQEDSEEYYLARECIDQGSYFYTHKDDVYRENAMAENFQREFDKLSGESIMGIYGAAHAYLDALNYTGEVDCMAKQLKAAYGDAIHSEDLSWIEKDIDPERIDTITVDGKEYEAPYYGETDLSRFSDTYVSREFWRLENAYDDFKSAPEAGQVLPYNNYPMLIEEGQVLMIDYHKKDGTVERKYYRSDGTVWQDMPSTDEFEVP